MDKKNLDELFREKFKAFRETPDEKVWTAIERSLDKKRKKRVVPLWWKLGGVAAVLAIMLIALYPFDDIVEENPAVTDTEHTDVDGSDRDGSDTVTGSDAVTESDAATDENQEDVLQIPETSKEVWDNNAVANGSEDAENTNTEQYKNSDKENFSGVDSGITDSDTESNASSPKIKIQKDSAERYPANMQLTANERDGSRQDADGKDTDGQDASKEYAPFPKKDRTESIGNKNTEALATTGTDTPESNDTLTTDTNDKNRDVPGVKPEDTRIALGQEKQEKNEREREKRKGETPGREEVAQNGIPGEVANKTAEDANKTSDVAADGNKKSIFEALEERADEEKIAEGSHSRWSAGPSVAPVYFNAMGEGSPIDPGFSTNSKSGGTNMSYGLSVAYAINDKMSVRSGIHRAEYGYDTENVGFSPTLAASSSGRLQNVAYAGGSENLALNDAASGSQSPEALAPEFSALNSTRDGTVAQSFGYLEVPLELDYALIDRRFGVKLLGGISSLFLIDNSVTLSSGNLTTEIGEASNLNDLNFSTNIGFGVNYKFTPRILLNIEPVFKYQLNTFSDTSGDFRPYSVGVYSGLNFRF